MTLPKGKDSYYHIPVKVTYQDAVHTDDLCANIAFGFAKSLDSDKPNNFAESQDPPPSPLNDDGCKSLRPS